MYITIKISIFKQYKNGSYLKITPLKSPHQSLSAGNSLFAFQFLSLSYKDPEDALTRYKEEITC